MFRYPTALTIAGSDSSGGAGIQADLKTFSALGVFGASVITAITAQNTQGVRGIQAVSPEIVKEQLCAVWEDLTIDAVKIGMLHNRTTVRLVAEVLRRFSPPVVILDPVMISTSGSKLMEDEAINALVDELFPLATLLTPNANEAAFLTGIAIRTETDMERAARKLLDLGCQAVLMKGGHLPGDTMTDWLFTRETAQRFTAPAYSTPNTHGTGCTLSSAIAACMAQGNELQEAVRKAKDYVTSAIREGADVRTGKGHGPLNHLFHPVPLIKIPL